MSEVLLFPESNLPIDYGPGIILREANGVAIRQRSDNYFDATAMCKAYRKSFAHYRENATTQERLEALSANIGIPILDLIQSQVGGNHTGTWVHRRVAIDLAAWCSPIFWVTVNGWVDELLQGHPVNLAEARGIDLAVFDQFLAAQKEIIRGEFTQQRIQLSEDIAHAVRTQVPRPRAEFPSAVRRAILTEWRRQYPRGLDPLGRDRIVDDDCELIAGVGELHHMNGNFHVGFKDGLPVTIPFHRKLTADRDQTGDEWRRARDAHRHFLNVAESSVRTIFDVE